MSDGDAQQLDRKYLEVAGHLRACWAFEQFSHRLQRSVSEGAAIPGDIDFGTTYNDLKQIAAELESGDHQLLRSRLEDLKNRLHRNAAALRREDNKLSPADLRRFVGRVRRLDEELLLGLLHFYVFSSWAHAWDADLTDRVDFLLSRLAEDVSGPLLNQDRVRFNTILLHLWGLARAQPPQGAVVAALRAEIDEVAVQVGDFADLDDLQQSGTISRYRRIKHGLGSMFVEPSIAQAILKTNVELGRKVQQLYDKAEGAIAAGFSRLAGLEGSIGFSEFMSIELDSLRLDIERLAEGRQHDDLRIDTVRQLSRQADAVLSRLDSPEDRFAPQDAVEIEAAVPAREPGGEDLVLPTGDQLAADLLERLLSQLEALLVASGTLEEADEVVQDPGLPIDLERREVEAYLLLRDESSPDAELDRMLLTAASLRLRLSILHDHLAAGTGGLAELEAATALELAEDLLESFRRLVIELEAQGPTSESSELRFLKIRLMSSYASLWLEVNAGPS